MYNYKKASLLWNRLLEYVFDFSCSSDEMQRERRFFLYTLTRKTSDISIYVDYLKNEIFERRPCENAKSRVYDFNVENDIMNLIDDITNFNN